MYDEERVGRGIMFVVNPIRNGAYRNPILSTKLIINESIHVDNAYFGLLPISTPVVFEEKTNPIDDKAAQLLIDNNNQISTRELYL